MSSEICQRGQCSAACVCKYGLVGCYEHLFFYCSQYFTYASFTSVLNRGPAAPPFFTFGLVHLRYSSFKQSNFYSQLHIIRNHNQHLSHTPGTHLLQQLITHPKHLLLTHLTSSLPSLPTVLASRAGHSWITIQDYTCSGSPTSAASPVFSATSCSFRPSS